MSQYEKLSTIVIGLKDRQPDLVIFGYDTCPFTARSIQTVKNRSTKCSNEHKVVALVTVTRTQGTAWKKKLNVSPHTTFPMVFLRQPSGKMHYIGGSTDLSDHVNNC